MAARLKEEFLQKAPETQVSTVARSQAKRSLQAWGLEGNEQNCQLYVAAREAYKAEGKNLTAEIVKGLKREVVSEASIGKDT